MKARGIFTSLLAILICALIFLNGCSSGSGSSLSSEKAITAYSLNGAAGTINEAEKTIAVTMPSLTNVYSLVATFTTTGVSVKVGTTTQQSGVTANSFTAPLAYTVTAADGTTITYTVTITVSRVWHYPSSLSDYILPSGSYAYWPRVAMDNIGNAIIVWGQYDGSYGQIYKSEYRNGVWTNPSSLSDHISPDGQSAGDPQIAMDNNGNAIIVWEQYDSSNNYQIFKSEYRNGVWTNPANLTDNISPDGLGVGMPQVAMDNNGNAIIVWEQYDSSNNYQIFKSEYRDGAWTNPASVADHISPEGGGNADSLYPEVAMDNNGNAIIVWKQYNGINYKIFKSEYRNGVWHNPTSLSDYINPDGTSPAFDPQVAMDNNGNAVIVWSQSDGSNYQIFKSEYRNGVWTNPSSLADNISPQGQDSFNPQVAMDNNGNAIIVWYQRDESNIYQIFKSEYRKDVWTNPSSLSDHISPDGQHAWYSRVAMDGNGNAVIVWYQSDGSNYQIFKSEYRNGVWINPSSLSDNISPDGQDAFDPHVAMDNNGNAIIVWYQSDGTQWQLFKSEYR